MGNILSIIISTKDDQDCLARQLASIASQTIWPDEVFLIDDGSTDGSKDVVRQFYEKLKTKPHVISELSCVTTTKVLMRE